MNIESVEDAAAQMAVAEKSERTRILRAFRKARSRVLSLYGAEAAAKLADDFRMKTPEVRKLRLFRNAKKARVWIGGNPMNLGRYNVSAVALGVSVPVFGVIPGAFILRGGNAVFAPESAVLPGWATFSGKPWRPRGDKRTLRKISVRTPENFRARYAPNTADIRATFEAEFCQLINKK